MVEESPQYSRITHKTDCVPKNDLSAQPPPEEAEVRGMAEVFVEARGDQFVALVLSRLYLVVEVCAGMSHGQTTDRLPNDNHHEPKSDYSRRVDAGLPAG